MLKEKLKKIIYLSLIIMWMIVVFMFSNENGDKSQSTSRTVTKTAIKIFTQNKNLTEKQIIKLVENTDYLVRKFAHFSIYILGGILIYNYFNTFNLKVDKKIIVSIMLGILYATSDELHQFFVAGRSAQVLDVCIDSLGIILGVLSRVLIKNGGLLYECKGRKNK